MQADSRIALSSQQSAAALLSCWPLLSVFAAPHSNHQESGSPIPLIEVLTVTEAQSFGYA